MIIVMESGVAQAKIDAVLKRVQEMGLEGHVSVGVERTVIGVVGYTPMEIREPLEQLAGVEEVLVVGKPFKLASRDFQKEDSVLQIRDVTVGGSAVVVIAGPCSVESEQQIMETGLAVKAAGAHLLRGGAFKPRTSPYTFRGMGEDALKLLAQVRDATGLPIVTEVMSERDIETIAKYADVLQIGARNSQNFMLLDEVGRSGMPVLLKRGISGTVQELLLSAEYILAKGNRQVMLCERGIRTYETATRSTLDLNAVPVLKAQTHLPVIVDPSHGTGKWKLVPPMSLAAVAAGADGLIIEVHPNPDFALSDGAQSLTPANFSALMPRLDAVARAIGRSLAQPTPQPALR